MTVEATLEATHMESICRSTRVKNPSKGVSRGASGKETTKSESEARDVEASASSM